MSGPPNEPEAALPFAPSAAARPRVRALVACFVLFQLLVPLGYHLRDDPFDERFAWRMFSAMRLRACEVRAREGIGALRSRNGARSVGEGGLAVRPIDLAHTVHVAWIHHLRRSHRRVQDAFLAARCARPEVRWVELETRCRGFEPEVRRLECRADAPSVEGPP